MAIECLVVIALAAAARALVKKLSGKATKVGLGTGSTCVTLLFPSLNFLLHVCLGSALMVFVGLSSVLRSQNSALGLLLCTAGD